MIEEEKRTIINEEKKGSDLFVVSRSVLEEIFIEGMRKQRLCDNPENFCPSEPKFGNLIESLLDREEIFPVSERKNLTNNS